MRIITLSVLPVLLALEVAVAVERWGHESLALLRGASRSWARARRVRLAGRRPRGYPGRSFRNFVHSGRLARGGPSLAGWTTMRRAHLFLSDVENRRLLACLFGAILALIVFRFWSP